MVLKCLTCEISQSSFFTLNETANQIMVDPRSSIGVYRLELVLSDDNSEDP